LFFVYSFASPSRFNSYLFFWVQTLCDFQYLEASGKDQGINVRKKAQTLVALIKDKDRIREVRNKAAANRDKYALEQSIA